MSLFVGAVLFAPALVHACSCRGATDLKSQFIRAQNVVIAEITDTTLIRTVHKEHDLEYIVAGIEVIEDLKRSPDTTELAKVIDLVPEAGNCAIGLISGMEYVFFVDDKHYEDEESEMGWINEDNYVGKCTGSRMINVYSIKFDEEHAQLKELAEMNKRGELAAEEAEKDCEDTVYSDSSRYNN